jgi:CheY-like chemotaxis protein
VFSFDLPMSRVTSVAKVPTARPRREGKRRVLLVEDNLDSSESLRMLIELWGHEVQVAFDADAGLDRIRAFKPEVVFCDLKLGGAADGLALAEAIRADHGLHQPFLVALTGFGQPSDHEQTRAAGFDRHLTKPAEPDVIRQLIEDGGS